MCHFHYFENVSVKICWFTVYLFVFILSCSIICLIWWNINYIWSVVMSYLWLWMIFDIYISLQFYLEKNNYLWFFLNHIFISTGKVFIYKFTNSIIIFFSPIMLLFCNIVFLWLWKQIWGFRWFWCLEIVVLKDNWLVNLCFVLGVFLNSKCARQES